MKLDVSEHGIPEESRSAVKSLVAEIIAKNRESPPMPTERTVEQICRDLLEIADRQDEVIVSVVEPQKMSASDVTAMANELAKILERDAKDAERWRKYRATYEYRKIFACDVCQNCPDEDGYLEHGRGCYTQSEDGGGTEHIDLDSAIDGLESKP